MTSVLRQKAQIPSIVKYIVNRGSPDTSGGILTSSTSAYAFTVPPGTFGSADLVEDFTIGTDYGSAGYAPALLDGEMYKDTGRFITIIPSGGSQHLAIYRQVQLMNSALTEGVSGSAADGYNSNIYVKMWSAALMNNYFVRTG